MKKEDIQFEIDQLRKDKIIYGVEACAVNLICLFGFMFSNQYLPSAMKDNINWLLLIGAVGYSIFMGIGNFNRLSNIKKLEKKLNKK